MKTELECAGLHSRTLEGVALPFSPCCPALQSVGDTFEDRWQHMLVGVAAADFGDKRRLSRTTMPELRRRVWENRSLLATLMKDPADALEHADVLKQTRSSDPELLRLLLGELLLWCAPSGLVGVVQDSTAVRRTSSACESEPRPDLSDEAGTATLGSLAPGDYVALHGVVFSEPGGPRWQGVVPFSLSSDEVLRVSQWRQRSGSTDSHGPIPAGWIRIDRTKSEPSPCRFRLSSGPRTLFSLATEADEHVGTAGHAAVQAAAGEPLVERGPLLRRRGAGACHYRPT